MNSALIKKDVESFQASVKKLSDGVAKASSLWNDPQFSALSAAIGKIAGFSKDLIVNGDKCCTSIDRFAKISEERV